MSVEFDLDADIAKLRRDHLMKRDPKKPSMPELSNAEAKLLLRADGNVKVVAKVSRHPCGRRRKDGDRARVRELKNQGKTYPEIKAQMDKETGEHRSEDAYRKLASLRKPAKTGKNSAK